jgi:spore maturation protein B
MIEEISNGLFLSFVLGIPLYGAYKKVRLFDAFVDGARDGFTTIIKIIPYLVGMLVAIGMLRASGFFDSLGVWLTPIFSKTGFPKEVLPLALVRPFSGGAATGVMAELMHTHGGNSFISKVAATMMGSTETTFYVVAVYFGAVGIKKTRYAVPVGLLADLTGVIAAVVVCRWMFL